MRAIRIGLVIVLALFALIMLYNVFTLPAFAVTGPAILAIAAIVFAWFVYPRRPKT